MTNVTQGSIKRYSDLKVTANGTTAVSFTVQGLKTDSVILYSLNTVGGTPAGAPYTFSKNVTTGVVQMKSVAGDTSIYNVVVLA